MAMTPRLHERYNNDIIPKMMEKFGWKNRYQVPRLKKIVVNIGLGEAVANKQLMDAVLVETAVITGQRPTVRKTKKAIAGFKVRKGSVVGCKVTLRKARMYEFMDRLINTALPRIRDFGGLSRNSFDQKGNYTFGISEQAIFPEIDADRMPMVHGMDITFAMSAKNKNEGMELLSLFGMPFKK